MSDVWKSVYSSFCSFILLFMILLPFRYEEVDYYDCYVAANRMRTHPFDHLNDVPMVWFKWNADKEVGSIVFKNAVSYVFFFKCL